MSVFKKLKSIISKTGCVDTWDYHSDDFKKPDPVDKLTEELINAGIIVIPKFNVGDSAVRLRTENLRPTGEILKLEIVAVETTTTYVTKNTVTGAISSFTDEDIGERVFKNKKAAKKFLQKQSFGEWLVTKTERAYNDAEYPIEYTCSVCGRTTTETELYCHCGARMA